jgi:succinate dehydrogenase/fumarate reductase cytochrome b subunit
VTLRGAHRGLAVVLALFLALHLGNHLAGLWGQEAHRAVQEALRPVYRHVAIEPLLLAAVAAQAVVGVTLAARRRRVTLQTASGFYVALFLAVHVGAVLGARWQGTDTDLAFAAAGLHAERPWPLVFGLYYGVAVLAVFAHLSVPMSRRSPVAGWAAIAFGGGFAFAIVALLAGHVTPLAIPPALIAAFP